MEEENQNVGNDVEVTDPNESNINVPFVYDEHASATLSIIVKDCADEVGLTKLMNAAQSVKRRYTSTNGDRSSKSAGISKSTRGRSAGISKYTARRGPAIPKSTTRKNAGISKSTKRNIDKERQSFTCTECTSKFVLKTGMERHRLKKHSLGSSNDNVIAITALQNGEALSNNTAYMSTSAKSLQDVVDALSKNAVDMSTSSRILQDVDAISDNNVDMSPSAINKRNKERPYMCDLCPSQFGRKDNLKRHMYKMHGKDSYTDTDTTAKTNCTYPGCEMKFYHQTRLIKHIEEDHAIRYESENLQFESNEEFRKWKKKEENDNYVYFSASSGKNRGKQARYTYYHCQRNGSTRSHRKKGDVIRKTNRRNKKGLSKIDKMCPARMLVKIEEDGITNVTYIKSHSHPVRLEDTQHHPIPSEVKEEIRQQLLLGVSNDDIYKSLRGELGSNNEENSTPMKKHVVSHRVISEIKRKLKVDGRIQKKRQSGRQSARKPKKPRERAIKALHIKQEQESPVPLNESMNCNSSSDVEIEGESEGLDANNYQLLNPVPAMDVDGECITDREARMSTIEQNFYKLQSYLENEHILRFTLPHIDSVLQELVSTCNTVIEVASIANFENLTVVEHVVEPAGGISLSEVCSVALTAPPPRRSESSSSDSDDSTN